MELPHEIPMLNEDLPWAAAVQIKSVGDFLPAILGLIDCEGCMPDGCTHDTCQPKYKAVSNGQDLIIFVQNIMDGHRLMLKIKRTAPSLQAELTIDPRGVRSQICGALFDGMVAEGNL